MENTKKSAMELAIKIVDQWDKYDRFRVTEADKVLWDGDEPDNVVIARALIAAKEKNQWRPRF